MLLDIRNVKKLRRVCGAHACYGRIITHISKVGYFTDFFRQSQIKNEMISMGAPPNSPRTAYRDLKGSISLNNINEDEWSYYQTAMYNAVNDGGMFICDNQFIKRNSDNTVIGSSVKGAIGYNINDSGMKNHSSTLQLKNASFSFDVYKGGF